MFCEDTHTSFVRKPKAENYVYTCKEEEIFVLKGKDCSCRLTLVL
jgi:hypothetical protein